MQTLQTPYFMIREKDIENEIRLLKNSLSENWHPDHYGMGFSVKTNALPWLLKYVQKNGFRAEIVSSTEYELVKRLGFAENNMIYNGPVKTEESFCRIVLGGGIVNLDSTHELNWMEELSAAYPDRHFDVGVRVNFDLEAQCPGETMMGKVGGRFGYCYENGVLGAAITRLNGLPNVTVSGLHMHTTSQSRTLHIYRTTASMVCRISREYNLDLKYVDMGGGYYGGLPDKPNYADYFRVICEELKKELDPARTTIIAEPGISLISKASTFVTSVTDHRNIRGNHYIVTDGSRTNIDPMWTRHWYLHHFEKLACGEREIRDRQIVCGFTCLDHDRLFEIEREEALLPGDRIIYENVGGYTMCMNSLFIRYFPAIYVESGGDIFAAREAWGVDEFLQKCHWPE